MRNIKDRIWRRCTSTDVSVLVWSVIVEVSKMASVKIAGFRNVKPISLVYVYQNIGETFCLNGLYFVAQLLRFLGYGIMYSERVINKGLLP
jgi:hypothetical protein